MNNSNKSVKEIGKIFGISRTKLQRYEREGLIKHSGRNKYGHLFYDHRTVNRIIFIRYLQECGYQLPQIAELFKLGTSEIKDELSRRIEILRAKVYSLDSAINKAERLITELNDFDEEKLAEIIMGDREK